MIGVEISNKGEQRSKSGALLTETLHIIAKPVPGVLPGKDHLDSSLVREMKHKGESRFAGTKKPQQKISCCGLC